MATRRLEQRLLCEIQVGGQFVMPDWFTTRKLFEVEKHYIGFSWTHDYNGRRSKGEDKITRIKVKAVRGGGGILDNEDVYVMQSILVENSPSL